MWKRFIRALKALFGGAISAIEDPKLILEENIRELNNQVPKLNRSIESVLANVKMLEKDQAEYKNEETQLMSKMKAAINQGRDDIAGQFALRLEQVKSSLAGIDQQLVTARAAYEKSLEVKKAFMKEKDKKIKEAQEALRANERAKYQSAIADAMEQFEVGGIDATHQEMLQRVNEQTAKNEARVELAMNSVDTSGAKLEEEAEKLRAAELVKQMKLDMGLGGGGGGTTTTEDPNRTTTL